MIIQMFNRIPPPSVSFPAHPPDKRTRAGFRVKGADIRVQADEAAAPETADGSGKQAEGGDGRAQAAS